jgi:hypothetical protein
MYQVPANRKSLYLRVYQNVIATSFMAPVNLADQGPWPSVYEPFHVRMEHLADLAVWPNVRFAPQAVIPAS